MMYQPLILPYAKLLFQCSCPLKQCQIHIVIFYELIFLLLPLESCAILFWRILPDGVKCRTEQTFGTIIEQNGENPLASFNWCDDFTTTAPDSSLYSIFKHSCTCIRELHLICASDALHGIQRHLSAIHICCRRQ